MNVYLSGSSNKKMEYDPRLLAGRRFRLFSCHGSYLNDGINGIESLQTWGGECEIMLDSGAFTAWSKGHEVDRDDLIRNYARIVDQFEGKGGIKRFWLISLDKIPGSPGVTASPAEIDEAVKISDVNFAVLQKIFGDRVLPVFHQNESQKRLLEVAAMNHYICVSPRNDLVEKHRLRWSKEAHALLPREIKTHGLAATGSRMMNEVEWWSVDSASWRHAALNGNVYADWRLKTVALSDKAGSVLKMVDKHYNTLPSVQQDALRARFESYGFTLEGLQRDFYERAVYNRTQVQEAERRVSRAHAEATPVQESLFEL